MRKSNKTARVLSLLTSDKKEASEEESAIHQGGSLEQPLATEPSAVSQSESPQALPVQPASIEVPLEPPGQVQQSVSPAFVPTPPEISSVQTNSSTIPETSSVQTNSSIVQETTEPQKPEETKPVSELIKEQLIAEIEEENPFSNVIIPSGTYEDETHHPIKNDANKKIPSVKSVEFEEFGTEKGAIKIEDDYDYCYINVLEEIVREKVPEYMDKFDVCKCNRCVVDTMALSLTNLPSKYIVVEKSKISPLLNYYDNKYSSSVTAEITKACMVVSANPHHNK